MSDNDELAARLKQQLDQQTLSDETLGELRKVRMTALAESTGKARPGWIPVTALAGLALITAGLLFNGLLEQPEYPLLEADELALIDGDEEFELLQELEFYAWLDAEGKV